MDQCVSHNSMSLLDCQRHYLSLFRKKYPTWLRSPHTKVIWYPVEHLPKTHTVTLDLATLLPPKIQPWVRGVAILAYDSSWVPAMSILKYRAQQRKSQRPVPHLDPQGAHGLSEQEWCRHYRVLGWLDLDAQPMLAFQPEAYNAVASSALSRFPPERAYLTATDSPNREPHPSFFGLGQTPQVSQPPGLDVLEPVFSARLIDWGELRAHPSAKLRSSSLLRTTPGKCLKEWSVSLWMQKMAWHFPHPDRATGARFWHAWINLEKLRVRAVLLYNCPRRFPEYLRHHTGVELCYHPSRDVGGDAAAAHYASSCYSIPMEHAMPLIASRECVLHRGVAYVTYQQALELAVDLLALPYRPTVEQLANEDASLSPLRQPWALLVPHLSPLPPRERKIFTYQVRHHFLPHLGRLYKMLGFDMCSRASVYVAPGEASEPQYLEPPCLRRLHQQAPQHRPQLKHHQRLIYQYLMQVLRHHGGPSPLSVVQSWQPVWALHQPKYSNGELKAFAKSLTTRMRKPLPHKFKSGPRCTTMMTNGLCPYALAQPTRNAYAMMHACATQQHPESKYRDLASFPRHQHPVAIGRHLFEEKQLCDAVDRASFSESVLASAQGSESAAVQGVATAAPSSSPGKRGVESVSASAAPRQDKRVRTGSRPPEPPEEPSAPAAPRG